MFKSRILHKKKIYDHELSPLLMQNSYSKLVLALKMLSISKLFAGLVTTN